ncbi:MULTISPECIES: hypothetical protein [unclassified Salmonella]|uniref:hypothetical protein n=1 Tax=unclassified Salmonella TaxID=2614656 RepID=UPI001272B515|nr:hypothetical protein [Salmonella sp. 32020501-2019-00050]EBB6210408.1 hypothetical protein [Salmonella enterica]ECH8734651.1 hypothetical protein [Salmonella enterica subsp. enterica serovar Wandsworth]EDN8388588.1 hypothetical protein [Salmonella enterica subsp. enterica serovar Wandsworth]EDS5037867.1 hypothetical protein [Salmonella enterica subsp. enterica serovar Wandsworth]EDT6630340.1 hypothetical protein [Salmonella enterica subsp. enterica serovar Wandsworth]
MTSQNSTFSFEQWEKSALSELEILQTHVSKALMKYQSNTDKAALGESATRYMGELRTAVTRILKATPAIQQKVDDITDLLCLMADFSGVTLGE